jgi:hypothetical protein
MTDARFPEKWLNDRRVLRLSDSAFRLFVIGNAWAVSNRTDGEMHVDDLPLLPSVDVGFADELAKAGLWERIGDRWLIADYANVQTTKAQLEGLEHKRMVDRERQARHRAGSPKLASPRESSGGIPSGFQPDTRVDVTVDVTRDIPRDGTRDTKEGQDRTGAGEEGPYAREEDQSECLGCGRWISNWILEPRDGYCITCNQARQSDHRHKESA